MVAASPISMDPDCASRLTHAGILAGLVRDIEAPSYTFKSRADSAIVRVPDISNFEQRVTSNGVLELLGALPFNGHVVGSLAEGLLVCGLLSVIRDTFKINLLTVGGPEKLVDTLKAKSPLDFLAKPSPVPPIAELQFTSAALALREVNVDILEAGGRKQLADFLARPAVRTTISNLQIPALSRRTLGAVSNVDLALSTRRSLAKILAERPGPLPTTSGLSGLAALRKSAVTRLWVSASAGVVAGRALPDPSAVQSWNTGNVFTRQLERLVRTKASEPQFQSRVAEMWKIFRANGICDVLARARLGGIGPHLATGGLPALNTVTALDEFFDVDALSPAARTHLKPKLEVFGRELKAEGRHFGAWTDLVVPLTRLADLGTALS